MRMTMMVMMKMMMMVARVIQSSSKLFMNMSKINKILLKILQHGADCHGELLRVTHFFFPARDATVQTNNIVGDVAIHLALPGWPPQRALEMASEQNAMLKRNVYLLSLSAAGSASP